MADAVQETVHFKVTIQSIERGGQWTTTALETGVITAGATRGEAESKSSAAHVMLARRIKQEGVAALANESVAQLPIAA